MEFSICTVRQIKCPPTYLLQLSDSFDITTGKSIWVHYLENHFWAPEAGTHSACLSASYRDKKQVPGPSLPSRFLSALTFPGYNPRRWAREVIAARPWSRQWEPASVAFGRCSPGTAPMQTQEESPRWVKYAGSGPEEGWKSVVILLSDVHISNSSIVSKSSSSKLQIPLFNSLNSARNNSRIRFRQWNVRRFLLVMGSQYHLNSWIIWFFFLPKLDIYKIENPQCFSFQELSGKSLLYYR